MLVQFSQRVLAMRFKEAMGGEGTLETGSAKESEAIV